MTLLTTRGARALTIAVAIGTGATLAGCSLNGSGTSQDTGAASGKATDVAVQNRGIKAVNIGSIKHIIGPENPGSQIGMTLCEGLTRLGADHQVIMAAAKSVTSKDNQTWDVTLQQDRTFDNGEPITAQTWVDSFNYTAYGPNAMTSNYAFMPIKGYDQLNPSDANAKPKTDKLSGLKVTGKYSFTLTTTTPNNDVPFMFTTLPFCPMPSSAFKDMNTFDKHPVGNGPYLLKSLDAKKDALVVTNPKYKGWRQPNPPTSIDFMVYNDPNTAYNDIAAGNVDIMRNLPPALVAQGKKTLGDKGLTAMPLNVLEEYVTWPTYLDKQFPKQVRVAFSQLIDRDSISKNLFLGADLPARSLVPNSVGAFRNDPCAEACKFDPQAAKQKVDSAGFSGSIPVYYASDGGNATTDAATVLAITNEAKKVGIKITPQPVPGNVLYDTIAKHQQKGPAIQTWGSSFPGASEWIASIPVDANYGLKYDNPKVASAITAALGATSESESNSHWRAAEDQILADQVIQPLFYQVEYIAHTPCVAPGASGGDMVIVRTSLTCNK